MRSAEDRCCQTPAQELHVSWIRLLAMYDWRLRRVVVPVADSIRPEYYGPATNITSGNTRNTDSAPLLRPRRRGGDILSR